MLRKPVADDAAVKKCDDAIGVLRHIVVMCDEHDGLVEIACERANHIYHFGFGFGIEIAGRSSANTTCGRVTKARAMPTRCC